MKSKSGFTIVELLIVIVVIAILAAITIVAYNGIQQRARMSSRSADVASIQKALEVYRAENGTYPLHVTTTAANLPSGFGGSYGSATAYSYSVATNNTWMKPLVDAKVIGSAPVDPVNDNSNFYMYYANNTSVLADCPTPLYVLILESPEANNIKGSKGVNCPGFANFSVTANRAVFSNLQR